MIAGNSTVKVKNGGCLTSPAMIRVRMSQLAKMAATAATGRLASARPAPYTATGTKKRERRSQVGVGNRRIDAQQPDRRRPATACRSGKAYPACGMAMPEHRKPIQAEAVKADHAPDHARVVEGVTGQRRLPLGRHQRDQRRPGEHRERLARRAPHQRRAVPRDHQRRGHQHQHQDPLEGCVHASIARANGSDHAASPVIGITPITSTAASRRRIRDLLAECESREAQGNGRRKTQSQLQRERRCQTTDQHRATRQEMRHAASTGDGNANPAGSDRVGNVVGRRLAHVAARMICRPRARTATVGMRESRRMSYRSRPFVRCAIVAVPCVVAAAVALWILPKDAFDLRIFLAAGQAVLHGHHPYATTVSKLESGSAFVYPLPAAYLFAPISTLDHPRIVYDFACAAGARRRPAAARRAPARGRGPGGAVGLHAAHR